MTFDEVAARYAQLSADRVAARLSHEQFLAAVGELQVQDGSGTWWAPNPETGGWLRFDGSAWVPHRAGTRRATAAQLMEQRGMEAAPLSRRARTLWSIVSIAGGAVAGLLWLLYSGLGEGRDFGTSIIMLLLPVGLALFRGPVDRLLLPLQGVRQKIPRLILIGLGLAAPYIMAHLIYGAGGLIEYSYMRWSMVLGTLVAYAILRTPQVPLQAAGGPAAMAQGTAAPTTLLGTIASILLRVAMIFGPILWASIAHAHDFLKNPLNVRDGLRTGGAAQLVAGTGAGLESVLVNAPELRHTLFPPGDEEWDDFIVEPELIPWDTAVFASPGDDTGGTGIGTDPFEGLGAGTGGGPTIKAPPPKPAPEVKGPGSTALEGKDAMKWLADNGLVQKNAEGKWVKSRQWDRRDFTSPASRIDTYGHDGKYTDQVGDEVDPNIVLHVKPPSGTEVIPDTTPQAPAAAQPKPAAPAAPKPDTSATGQKTEAQRQAEREAARKAAEKAAADAAARRKAPTPPAPAAPVQPAAPPGPPPSAPPRPTTPAPGPTDAARTDAPPQAPPSTDTLARNAIDWIHQDYGDRIPAPRKATLSTSDVTVADRAEYNRIRRQLGGEPSRRSVGFFDRKTGRVVVRADAKHRQAILVHEYLHKDSNPAFKKVFGRNWNEAATEHFNNRMARTRNYNTSWSRYNRDGRTKFMRRIWYMNQNLAEKAFFGGSRQDAANLARHIERRLGRGAVREMRRACDRGDYDGAIGVIRERSGSNL